MKLSTRTPPAASTTVSLRKNWPTQNVLGLVALPSGTRRTVGTAASFAPGRRGTTHFADAAGDPRCRGIIIDGIRHVASGQR